MAPSHRSATQPNSLTHLYAKRGSNVHQILRSRALKPDDARCAADWLAENCAIPSSLQTTLATRLSDALTAERMQGIVIEEFDDNPQSRRTMAIGLSVFVTPKLFDQLAAEPKPFLFAGLLDLAQADPEIFLGPDQIGLANGRAGLNLISRYMQADWDHADPRWQSIARLAHTANVRYLRGHRIRRALQQDWHREPDFYLASGYEVLSETPAHFRGDGQDGPQRWMTYFADAEVIARRPVGSPLSFVMQYEAPRCGFTPAEQRVLCKALDGMTDRQIADQLSISTNTIKLSWRNIYERIKTKCPAVLAGVSSSEKQGVRGGEKRRRVIAFVEDYPQEMRRFNSLLPPPAKPMRRVVANDPAQGVELGRQLLTAK